jgi:hypothetical protein
MKKIAAHIGDNQQLSHITAKYATIYARYLIVYKLLRLAINNYYATMILQHINCLGNTLIVREHISILLTLLDQCDVSYINYS